MVTLNKIYTKTGDLGTTSLGNGERKKKCDLRVVTYGNIDELNSAVGVSTQFASKNLLTDLIKIQQDLFDLGADFCSPIADTEVHNKTQKLRISNNQVSRIEKQIDMYNLDLEPLKSFVLPGGSLSASHLHICRTVCRRAERSAVELNAKELINQEALKYLNRLSDWFFVAARFENDKGTKDILWIPGVNR